MTKKEAMDAIYTILEHELKLPTLEQFHQEARMNEDLALDSIMILQLLLELEMKYGVAIPDEHIDIKAFYTVGALAAFVADKQEEPLYD